MSNSQQEFAETQSRAQSNGACTDRVIGDRLSAYITNPLDDAIADGVEDHLLKCRHCREFFLTMLRIRGEASKATNARGDNGRASNDAKVLRLADFRK